MSNETKTIQKAKLDTPEALVAHYANAVQEILPRAFEPTKFIAGCTKLFKQVTSGKHKLADFDTRSLVVSMLDCASLGLDPNPLLGQAYFVPYRDNKSGKQVMQLIPGYKGLQHLAYNSGKVQIIRGVVVYENDKFEYTEGTEPRLVHEPTLGPRGAMLCAYAIAILASGATASRVCHRDEIMKAKAASKAGASEYSPWQAWPEEMWRKTAIRKLCKDLPQSPEMQRAVSIEDLNEAGKVVTRDYSDLPEQEFEEVAPELPDTARPGEDLKAAADAAQRKATGETQGTLV
jgi:recombination protein RecT